MTRTLTLRTSRESYTVRYSPGEEGTVIDALIAWVYRPDLAFTWFDAAEISRRMGELAAGEMGKVTK